LYGQWMKMETKNPLHVSDLMEFYLNINQLNA
jgi:hypothetical protein